MGNWAGRFRTRNASTLGQFLVRFVLPHLEGTVDRDWDDLWHWLGEIRKVGMYPTVALPSILPHRGEKAETIATIINDDMNSDVADAVAGAAEAIRHWIHLSAKLRIPRLPADLMATLLHRVVFRRAQSIKSPIQQLSNLVRERPDVITRSQGDLLVACLIPWNAATILPAPERGVGDFNDDDRPDLRAIGCLAGALGNLVCKIFSGSF